MDLEVRVRSSPAVLIPEMGMSEESYKPEARNPKGFRDEFPAELQERARMLERIEAVYSRYGFAKLETPVIEYLDVLGKYLPEADTPEGGVFSFRDSDSKWLALRYDLTAPLSRVVSQHQLDLPKPFRRYQVGPVFRQEKVDVGRFRQFTQFDVDTVGTASMAADAEACQAFCDALEAVGVPRGQYIVRVNNRKLLNGILEKIDPSFVSDTTEGKCLTVLRAIDKYDRLGEKGVFQLLTKGRKDESGDVTQGAGLSEEQANLVLSFMASGGGSRKEVLERLNKLVEGSSGEEGARELEEIDLFLDATGYGCDQIIFDPTVIRGLAYYTGPVFEATLTFETKNEKGEVREFGSVAGGGRYDDLVERFTGQKTPATGGSIGVDRLLSALQYVGEKQADPKGPVVVIVFDKGRVPDYLKMVKELRDAGISAELYMGKGNLKKQFKYADARNSPAAVIAGGDEFEKGEVSVKDLALGRELSKEIEDRDTWRKQQAQVTIKREELVGHIQKLLDNSEAE